MKSRPDVAKLYIIYREERAKLREQGWVMSDLQRDIYEKNSIVLKMNLLMDF